MIYINTLGKEGRKKSYITSIIFFWQCFKLNNKKKIPFIRKEITVATEFEEYSRVRINKRYLKDNLKRLLSMKL